MLFIQFSLVMKNTVSVKRFTVIKKDNESQLSEPIQAFLSIMILVVVGFMKSVVRGRAELQR